MHKTLECECDLSQCIDQGNGVSKYNKEGNLIKHDYEADINKCRKRIQMIAAAFRNIIS